MPPLIGLFPQPPLMLQAGALSQELEELEQAVEEKGHLAVEASHALAAASRLELQKALSFEQVSMLGHSLAGNCLPGISASAANLGVGENCRAQQHKPRLAEG